MSRRKLTPRETRFLLETLSGDYKNCDIRLRKGEYQFDLAEAIASFQLEMYFPDAKDIIRRSYGEEKADDIEFRRKIQTILKKMEKNEVVRILPKKKPWELQRYALSSFKFQDVEKNRVSLATEQQIEKAKERIESMLSQRDRSTVELGNVQIGVLVFMIVTSYVVLVWALMQPTVNPFIFVSAFSLAVAGSLLLGKTMSRK